MRNLFTAAELAGSATALVVFTVARLSVIDFGLAVFLAALIGLSVWAASRFSRRLFRGWPHGAPILISIFGFVLVLSTTGLIIRSLELERSLTVLVSLFFLCGVSIGVAFGVIGAYLQANRSQ